MRRNETMRLAGAWLVAAMMLILLTSSVLMAVKLPKLTGRVNDYASILSDDAERQLDAALRAFEGTDSTQIVVLTIPSLDGEAIEDFSIRVAEAWKIGQSKIDNGAILLVAPNERKLRIEVGYGLEGKLTDLVAGRIIREVIVPAFKAGSFDQGVMAGVGAMMAAVKGEYTAPEGGAGSAGRRQSGSPLLLPLIAFIFLVGQLGRVRRPLGAAAGGVLMPLFGAIFLKTGLLMLLALIPLGLVAGYLLSLIAAGLSGGRHIGGGYYGGFGGGGGFSSGSFGGFSGGGGGFGGGGASGGW
ncbi:MAG: TPM domain-containing protein [Desulfobacterales bacterium]|jgi:uncharacterized protein|nr:TPM domain-containing protein [Desulfobacterales bacterium]